MVKTSPLIMMEVDVSDLSQTTELLAYENQMRLKEAQHNLQKQRLLPNINLEYFQGSNEGIDGNINGYQVGIKIPLLFNGQSSRIKASGLAKEAIQAESKNFKTQLEGRYAQLQDQLAQNRNSLSYYLEEGNILAEEILKTAEASYRNGEIDFFQYILSLENAYGIRLEYLQQLQEYNETVISLNYLIR